MTFKEAMEHYRAGTATEAQRQLVEQELEKNRLIAEYLDEQWDAAPLVPTAAPEELDQGLFAAYEQFDWRCKYAAVGVNGDFERYHSGDDVEKILVLSDMIQAAFMLVSKKRKAKFDCRIANDIVTRVTHRFTDAETGIF